MNMLKSKIALITGSSRGLGLEVAKNLSGKGCKIILTGRSQSSLEMARNQLTNPLEHIIFCADLFNINSIQSLFNLPFFPNIVVHCLGGKILGDEHPIKPEILMQSITLNLGVAINLNLHYLPLMQKACSGRIIHVSSDASETGRNAPGYTAAKAAINGYVKSTALFYARYNIMICAVLSGIFLHQDSAWAIKKTAAPDVYQKQLQQMPLDRFLRVDEIAEIISDIAMSESMAYLGSLIRLTGGF